MRIIKANEEFIALLGYSQGELQGMQLWDLDVSGKAADWKFRNICRFNGPIQTKYRRKDGTVFPVEVRAMGLDIGGERIVICFCQNNRELHRVKEVLQQRESIFRKIVEEASDVIFTLNPAGIVTYVSPNIKKQWGYSESEVEGKSCTTYVHPADVKVLLHYIATAFQRDCTKEAVEYRVKHRDNSWHWYALTAARAEDENQEPILICIARNITCKKEYEEKLKYLSSHDHLTGLYNRYYFEKELEALSKSNNYPISLLCCDLNELKTVNDTLGHRAGDILLKTCGTLLKKSLRTGDIVARVGGDEFAAILKNTDAETAAGIVARIYHNINAYNEKKPFVPLSVSIGLATADNGLKPLKEVFREADEQMYNVKNKFRQG